MPPSAQATVDAGRRVIRMERDAIAVLEDRIGPSFVDAAQLILQATGRAVVSGVGKSGIVGRKIAATLTSTGTAATFVHPVEALHGDLGITGPGDVAILISKSGESEELHGLLGYISRTGISIIALTGNPLSTLARNSTVVLDCSVSEEACPHGLAPTSSTTATLAMGDALAVAVLLARGFGKEDFARLHPGGALGRRLLLRVQDVMLTEVPVLSPDASMRDCVILLAKKRGTVAIADADNRLLGVVTAGDLTRLMERRTDFLTVAVGEVMTTNPKVARATDLGVAAVGVMERSGIMAMPVLDEGGRIVGMVHLHDLMRAGAL